MLNTMIANKKVFTNILLSFPRSWSHTPCSEAMILILEKKNIRKTLPGKKEQ